MGLEYEVVWPLGSRVGQAGNAAFGQRLDTDLNGKVIAELCDLDAIEDWFPFVREELKRRYPDIRIVPFEKFGLTHGSDEQAVMDGLPNKLLENEVDLVISGLGT